MSGFQKKSGAGTITTITSTGGSIIVTNPGGPITNIEVASAGGAVTSVFGRTGAVVAAIGDYTVAQVTGAAPLASPALTGTPTAPTATVGTNTTQVATTAFVLANLPAVPVASVFGRTGSVTAATGDYTAAQVTNAADKSSGTTQAFAGNVTAPNLNAAGTENVNTNATSGAAVTLQASTTSQVEDITLTANCTFTMPAVTNGWYKMVRVRTGAGGFTGTFTGVKWPGGTAPTVTATAARMDIYVFETDGTDWFGSVMGQNYTP